MPPKEVWLRYCYAKRAAASLLQEVVMGASADFDDVVDAFEMAALWKHAVSGHLQVGTETFGQMVESTANWRMLDGGEGSHEGIVS